MDQTEPRNPLYLLLLLVSLIFVATVLAYAIVPVLEEKAIEAGTIPPPSPFRDALREKGWQWLLAQLVLMFVLGIASMGLDRYRRWRQENETSNPTTSDISTTPDTRATPDSPA